MARGFVRTEAAARKYESILAKIAETQKNLATAREANKTEIDPSTGLPTSGGTRWDPAMAKQHIDSLESLREKEKSLLELFGATDSADKKKLKNTADQILAIRSQIKAIEDLLDVQAQLSITAQRARQGESLKNVTPFGKVISKTTPFGGTLTDFEGVAGTKTPLSDAIPIDLNKMEAMAQHMVDLRNTSAQVTAEVETEWIDLGGAISGALTDIAVGLGRAASGAENFGDAILQSLGGFMEQFGGALIALGIGKLSLEKFSGPGMIAAGFALAAAGAALESSVKHDASRIGSGGGSSSHLGTGVSRFLANTSVQDSSPQLVTVLKGEDLWIVLQNYQANNRFTRG